MEGNGLSSFTASSNKTTTKRRRGKEKKKKTLKCSVLQINLQSHLCYAASPMTLVSAK